MWRIEVWKHSLLRERRIEGKKITPPALSYTRGWDLPPLFKLKKARAGKRPAGNSPPTSASGKAFFPFWKESLSTTYSKCPLHVGIVPTSLDKNDGRSGSWFTVRKAAIPSSSTATANWRSIVDLPLQNTTSIETTLAPKKRHYNKKLLSSKKEKRVETRTRKIRLRLSREQKQVGRMLMV